MPIIEKVKSKNGVKRAGFQELGIAFSEFDYSGRGDADFIPALRGRQGIQTYRQMALNDATISSVMFAVEMSIRAVQWEIAQNEASDDDVDFLKTVIFEDMEHSFQDFLSEVVSFLVFGWGVHEIVYKLRNGYSLDIKKHSNFSDGKIGIRKLSQRPQTTLHRWRFREDGSVKAMEQQTNSRLGTATIPIEKLFYVRTTSSEANPEGKSMLRGAYRSWYLVKHIEQIEAIAIERELNGLPVVSIPGSLLEAASRTDDSPETASAKLIVEHYAEAAKNIKINSQGSLIIPSDLYPNNDGTLSNNRQVVFELLSSTGTRAIDTDKTISRYQAGIMRTVLADFLLLGSVRSGTGNAQTQDRSQLFSEALGGWLDMLEYSFNKQVISRLWHLNGFDVEKMPTIKHGSVTRKSLEMISGYVQKLSQAGMPLFPDGNLESHLRNVAEFPEASDELDELREDLGKPEPIIPSGIGGGGPPPKKPVPKKVPSKKAPSKK